VNLVFFYIVHVRSFCSIYVPINTNSIFEDNPIHKSVLDAYESKLWRVGHTYQQRKMQQVLLDRILEIQNRGATDHNKVILVEGIRRCGKTIFLRQVYVLNYNTLHYYHKLV